uniref:Uncharacterized protein n=1 Tax=Tetradesmus obliquus TaxID=3088 RepID=A0A383VDF3_TETOB
MFEAAGHAREGDVAYFKALTPAELSSLIVGRDEDGRTLFHTAAANGHLELLDLLAGSGATKVAEKQDDEGWTPLHSAVSSGREKVVAALLTYGVCPDTSNSGGQTALHYAASKGFVSIMRLLIKAGAKVNAKDKTGSTPLHRAASAGKYDTAVVLVEEGHARLDSHDKTGSTPLLVAVSCKEANIAVYLASKGADLEAANKEGETPLALAGELAAALQAARASGSVSNGTNGAMEH